MMIMIDIFKLVCRRSTSVDCDRSSFRFLMKAEPENLKPFPTEKTKTLLVVTLVYLFAHN
jgi:hypothetical protein